MEEKLKTNFGHKRFLLFKKYFNHIISILYIIYTFAEFIGDNPIFIGSIAHISLLPWIYLYYESVKYKYCYVHRLPLYYILTNELITQYDTYFKLPTEIFNLFVIHIILVAILMFGYTYYYLIKLKDVKFNKKRITADN